jgi:hypothetical protein
VTTGEDKGAAAEALREVPLSRAARRGRGRHEGIITIDDVLEDVAPELNR